MSTKKLAISKLATFVISAVAWMISIVWNPNNFEMIAFWTAIVASILCICFCTMLIIKVIADKRGKRFSGPIVFAIVDGVLGLGITAYAVYDIMTDTGWFAGLFGTILLIFIVPVTVVLLIGDLIFYFWAKRKK